MSRVYQMMLVLALVLVGMTAAGGAWAQGKKPVSQDPKLAITTAEVEQLLEAGPEKAPLLLVDARPAVKYEQGHVPGAVSIPKAMLAKNLDQLPKDKTLIFYCGGLKCPLSGQSAEIALENGFTDVRVWYEGMPGWLAAGRFADVELPYVEKLVSGQGQDPFLLIDARPAVKYQKAFIPGSMSLPKAEFELKKGLLPADKDLPLVFYCGGYKCKLSRQSAELAIALGYTRVSVFPAGEPAWREAGLPLWGNEASGAVAKAAPVAADALPEAIAPEEFSTLAASGKIFVVDVRNPEEFAEAHIPGSINIFDEDFIFKAKESVAKLPVDQRVVLLCNTGGRAASSYYAILEESDYPNKGQLQYLDNSITIVADGNFIIE